MISCITAIFYVFSEMYCNSYLKTKFSNYHDYKILNLFDDYYTYSCAWNLRYYLYTILYFPLKKGSLMKMSKGSRFYYSDSFFFIHSRKFSHKIMHQKKYLTHGHLICKKKCLPHGYATLKKINVPCPFAPVPCLR